MKRVLSGIFYIFIITAAAGAADTALQDRLAADPVTAGYRTGRIDPKVLEVPKMLNRKVFSNPEGSLEKLVTFLTADTDDPYLQVKRLHDWISLHISYYDYWADGESRRSIAVVLQKKSAECGGFADLFIEMARLAGFETRRIKGKQRIFGNEQGVQSGHVWNGVKIKGKWYLLDISRNRRSFYENGKPTALGAYNDRELFIHPMGKLLLQVPDDPEDQLIVPALGKEEIGALPFYRLGYIKYGVTFLTDIKKLITANDYSPYDPIKGLWIKYNLIEIKDDLITIEMKLDKGTGIVCTLKDEKGNNLHGYYHYYYEKDRAICQFSYPERGVYTAAIHAKNDLIDDGWTEVYKFKIKGHQAKGETLPLPDKLYKTKQFSDFNIKVLSHNIGRANPAGYYRVEAEYPGTIELVASMKNEKGDYFNTSNRFYSYVSPTRMIYYFSSPPGGDCFVTFWVRYGETGKFGPLVMSFKIANPGEPGPTQPPYDTLLFKKDFTEHDYIHLSDNLADRLAGDEYRISIQAPPGLPLSGRLADMKTNATVKGGYSFERDGENRYHFRFTPPPGGSYNARIYDKDLKLILEIKIKK